MLYIFASTYDKYIGSRYLKMSAAGPYFDAIFFHENFVHFCLSNNITKHIKKYVVGRKKHFDIM